MVSKHIPKVIDDFIWDVWISFGPSSILYKSRKNMLLCFQMLGNVKMTRIDDARVPQGVGWCMGWESVLLDNA